jgi:hypothetical protein
MQQTQLTGEIANDLSQDLGANDIRVLNEIEMLLAAGGDGIVIWQPPAP